MYAFVKKKKSSDVISKYALKNVKYDILHTNKKTPKYAHTHLYNLET